MSQKTYSIANFSQTSSWVVAYNGSYYYVSSGPTTDNDIKTIDLSDIPAGSVINSAYIEATFGSPNTGIAMAHTSFSLNGGAYTTSSAWDDTVNPRTEPIPVAYLTPGGTTSIKFSFRANGSTGGGAGTHSGSLSYSNITVYVDYTPPTAPTVSGVSTASSYLPPSTNTTLSWTAADGTLNAISSFTIQRRENGGAWANIATGVSSAARSYTVTSHASAGSYYEYQVIAVATYGNGSAVSGKLYSYSAPSVSSLLLDYSGSNQYRGAGVGLILSWSAANGSYNAITGYQVLRNDNGSGWYEISVASGGTVAAPGSGQSSQFAVLAYGTYSNSGYTHSPILYSYSAPSVPTGLGLSPASCKPGDSVTLSWAASSAGVGVGVTGYHIYENGAYKAAVSGVSYTFSAPSAGSYAYVVYAIGSVSGYNSGASSGVSLTVEDPKSTVALNKTTVAMDGSTTITATLTVSNATFTHTVRWYLDGTYTQTNNLDAGDTSDTFTLPLAWNNKYPSSTSGTATCLVTTYNGGVSVGTDSKTFSVTVPDSVVPTVSTGVSQLSGFGSYYLKSITGCRVTPTHGGAYGSTIVSWYAYGGGYSSSVLGVGTGYWDTGALTVVGTNNMTVVVTDSRGRTATHTNSTVSVTDYAPPFIYAYTAKRCDSNGTLLDTGTYIKVTASVAETSLTGNSITAFTVKYRQNGGSYGSASNLTEGVGLVVGAGGINEAYAYDVAVTATDSVGKSSTVVMQINPSQYLFDFKPDRAGIGRLSDPSTAKTFYLPSDWTTNIPVNEHTHPISDLTNLFVGGTNLLVKANYNADLVTIATNSRCGYGFRLDSGAQDAAEITGLVLAQSTDYTVSFTAWCASGTESFVTDLYPDTLPELGRTTVTITPTRTTWKLNSAHADMASCKLRFFPHPFTPSAHIYITDIKLEKGNVATDWSPAPADIVLAAYPVGAIYMSVNSTSPATLFGGTWAALGGRFLIGADGTYTAGNTGGAATHTLTVAELAAHGHSIKATLGYGTGSSLISSPSAGPSEHHYTPGTELAGGGEAHNNMPPYLAVYMWKRTA